MNTVFIKEAQKLWLQASLDGKYDEVLLKLEIHKQIIETFHVGPYYYFIFDLIASKFRFMSESVKDILGYASEDIDVGFLLSKIHPKDHHIFLNSENTFSEFLSKVPVQKITKYKLSFDYRIQNSLGVYVRVLQQSVVLQHDDKGKIGASLVIHTDISQIKSDDTSKLSIIGLDGEPSFYDVMAKKMYEPSKDFFSKREKEILYHLIKGIQSIEIAEKLSISRFTVDTHRKNILAKTGTKNTPELINKIVTEGLL